MFTARDVLKKRIAEAVVTSAVMEEAAIIHNTLVTTVDRQCLTNNHSARGGGSSFSRLQHIISYLSLSLKQTSRETETFYLSSINALALW